VATGRVDIERGFLSKNLLLSKDVFVRLVFEVNTQDGRNKNGNLPARNQQRRKFEDIPKSLQEPIPSRNDSENSIWEQIHQGEKEIYYRTMNR
jgi:hypothetical protein